MFWGVKSHWTDFFWSKDVAWGIELHENEEDIYSFFDEQKAVVQAFGRPVAVHVPIYIKRKLFGLSDDSELEIAVRCAGLGKILVVHIDATNERVYDRLSELLDRTESLICVENRPGISRSMHGMSSHDDFRKLFSRVDHRRLGIAFDIAHLYMGPEPEANLDGFMSDLTEKVRHVHIVDSDGIVERQIGYGIVDFDRVFARLAKLKRDVMVVPEVASGQLYRGAGFRYAIEKLSGYPINLRPASASSWP